MMKIQRYHRSAALGAAVGLVLSSPAWSAGKADDAALEEIVITATRSETNLQRTPIAVTALSGSALEQRGITNMADLSAVAPNLAIGSRSGVGNAGGAISIRGIGQDAIPPSSPGVGIYVDDVYSPNAFGNLTDLFDVERIEVLRGPQGTLFGRNTIAGAIQYVTVKPKLGEFGGFVEGTAGELHRADLSGAINVPVGDRVAFRVSLASKYRDGYVHDRLKDVNRGQAHSKEGRAQFHMDATDTFTVDAKFEALNQDTNGLASIPSAVYYTPPSAAALFGPSGLDQFISNDYYNIAGTDAPNFFHSNLRLGQLILGYALTDKIHLKSISAYQHVVTQVSVDQDGLPVPIFTIKRGDQTDNLFTQEFQVVGTSFDDLLHWTGGLYYYSGSLESIGGGSSFGPGPLLDIFSDYKVTTKSYAIYGQATYNLTSKLSLVGGLRYTKEDQDLDAGRGVNKALPGPPYTDSLSFRDTAPLLGINYQLTDDVMLYIKGSKGFRAGGFTPTAAGDIKFDPETAWTYEAGARMQFFNGRIRVNPTYFHTDWTKIQFNSQTIIGGLFLLPDIENGPDVKADGIELETLWAVTDHLSLNLSGAWLDARYSGNLPVTKPGAAVRFTLDSDLNRAPQSQFTVGGLYKLPLGDTNSLTTSINYTWTDKQRSAASDTDFVEEPAVGLLSARIEYALDGGKYSVAVFGTNLTDKAYLVGGINYVKSKGPAPTTILDIGRPRELGVTLRAKF